MLIFVSKNKGVKKLSSTQYIYGIINEINSVFRNFESVSPDKDCRKVLSKVKIVYKPLDQTDNKTNKTNDLRKNDKFSKMLDQHVNQTKELRGSGNTGNVETNKPANNSDEAYLALKNEDPEYYKKGIKKKTLSATFSSRNNSKLEPRLNKYKHLIEMKAKKYELDPNLLAGLIRQESNFNPYAVSHCGAMGLGQLMPETARYLGVVDPFNAAQNIEGAAKYLKEQLDTFGGNVNKALAAYNAGPGAVKKYGGIPPYRETQGYVRAVRSHYSQINKLNVFGDKKV